MSNKRERFTEIVVFGFPKNPDGTINLDGWAEVTEVLGSWKEKDYHGAEELESLYRPLEKGEYINVYTFDKVGEKTEPIGSWVYVDDGKRFCEVSQLEFDEYFTNFIERGAI